ncbi:hypothetical protein [Hoeflea poritis]|uniref:Asparagine synthetase domain-containing protein n=1 Tax=Hoeflea poritis TaxID=2993659 RepID=A0ABT4VTR9_9HYPH|nr:hypothetical protein [Hoeflea poritis]MDA4848004.1 hypothetical protein [Hoeflea poritis]
MEKPEHLSLSYVQCEAENRDGASSLAIRFSAGSYVRHARFSSQGAPLAATGDALLCLGLPPAMELGLDLHIDAEVDAGLIGQSADIQRLLCEWYAGYKPVSVKAGTTRREYLPDRGAGLYFSGGVDSCFSLAAAHNDLAGLVTVIGADVDPDDRDRVERLKSITGDVAVHYALKTVFVTTDIRQTSDPLIGWVEYHGAVLAAIRHMLAGEFENQLIASSADESSWNRRWGSHPALDSLWATAGARIEHHGLVDRLAKIERLAREPALMRHLRVCNLAFDNCGKCDKCLFMLAAFELLDMGGSAPTFAGDLPASPSLRVTGEGSLSDLVKMREYALEKGGHDDIVAAIDKGLRNYRLKKSFNRLVPVAEAKRRFKRLKRKFRFKRATAEMGA